jgi:hypothetical protein
MQSVPSPLPAGESRYFPATGPGAAHQRVLDLRCSVVVLSVSPEPGTEDLPTLTALRMGSGAKIVSAYVTDGESTPSDMDGALPFQVGARRRLEADRALRLIGGEALFLGFPDYGMVGGKARLADLWGGDSVVARLVRLIGSTRPDVILLARDVRSMEGDTARASLVRELLLEAAAISGRGSHTPGGWPVSRILIEDPSIPSGVSVGSGGVHPVWKKRFRDIAFEAAVSYASLRFRIGVWNKERNRLYRQLPRTESKPPGAVLDGFPLITPPLRDAGRDVAAAAEEAEKGTGLSPLRRIAVAISTVENTISVRTKELDNHDRRTLLIWKGALEDLRCAVRNIDVKCVVSDTLLARRQFFTLRFPAAGEFPSGGRSEIIFPTARDSTWWINNSMAYVLPFALPDTVELITPDNLPLNRPVAVNSHESMTVNTVFPYVIAHRDPDPVMNFAFRGEIVFGTGLAQTFEILTPIVRVMPGARLDVRLQNISRDPYKGVMSVGDSVVRDSRINFSLPRKDFAVTATIPLAWAEDAADGDYTIELHIGKGKAPATFTARKFRADADTAHVVGLVTGLSSSPVEQALRGLHVPCRLLGAGTFARAVDSGMHAIIIDRDAFALRRDAHLLEAAVAQWVRAGGHCIVLRQSPRGPDDGPLGAKIGFERGHPFPPETHVAAEAGSRIMTGPNLLSEGDWRDWIISRAQSSLQFREGSSPVVHVRDASTGAPLIASVPEGKGMLTAVALDIVPQLQIIHPGGYRLLANLLAY